MWFEDHNRISCTRSIEGLTRNTRQLHQEINSLQLTWAKHDRRRFRHAASWLLLHSLDCRMQRLTAMLDQVEKLSLTSHLWSVAEIASNKLTSCLRRRCCQKQARRPRLPCSHPELRAVWISKHSGLKLARWPHLTMLPGFTKLQT